MKRFRRAGTTSLPAALALMTLAAFPAAPASGMMTLELCNSEGEVREVTIPLERDGAPSKKDCASPCHACLSRQKNSGPTARK
ncbi:MAG: hypothetical protein ABJM16_13850 [Parasphingorhabdus sp.]